MFRLDITPEQAQSLADELSRAADAGLFHPSIVEPIAAGVEGTVAYRAEEYVAAESLDVAMRHYAPAPVDKALPFITQLAGAIDFARAAGVGHGSLHPRDIFVTPEEARATGFGVVDALQRVGVRGPVRRPYSAPERIEGRDWSTPADIFSLGAIAYELLTGRRPSGAGSDIGTLAGANVGVHADSLLAALMTAMAPDPARRYPTALAFAGALEAAARGTPAAASAVAAIPPAVDDISAERDEDEAHHELTLHEREEAEASEAMLLTGKAVDDPEAEADRLLLDAAAVASDDASQRYREDFQASPVPPEVSQEPLKATPIVAAPLSHGWASDRGRMFDPDADYRAAGAVVPAQGSRVLPLAAMLSIGLLVGFAVGYGVGSRDPGIEPGRAAVVTPTPRPAQAGKDWSEQTVAQPPAGSRQQPLATPPPIPSEAPPSRPAATAATRPIPIPSSARLVVRSTPSGAAVTVNNRWAGRTPLVMDKLRFGKYAVRVVQPGYAVAREDLVLSPDDALRTLSIRLRPQSPRGGATPGVPRPVPVAPGRAAEPKRAESFTGSIYVDSRPQGARVFLDNRPIGTTPVSIPAVPIGAHVVRLELPNYRNWSSSARVTAGEQARVTGSLERLQ